MKHFWLGLLALLPGCALPATHQTLGWRFEVGRPGTIVSPVAVEQTTGPLAMGTVTAAPAAQPGRPIMALAQEPCAPAAAAAVSSGPVLAAQPVTQGCSLDEICRRLDRLDARLNAAERAPMPRPIP